MMFLPMVTLLIFMFLYLSTFEDQNNLSYSKVRQSNKALDILDRRFADGKISRDEYLRVRSLLK
ncbi:MAG: SHOCT domain-containing protein [Clostridium lundense]|nr:SHOCT domain-containing protein [Clostridium lundense]